MKWYKQKESVEAQAVEWDGSEEAFSEIEKLAHEHSREAVISDGELQVSVAGCMDDSYITIPKGYYVGAFCNFSRRFFCYPKDEFEAEYAESREAF